MSFDAHAYDCHRPSYPGAALDKLTELGVLDQPRLVADVGSGTGIFTEALLARGHRVAGVEPVQELRSVAEERLSGFAGFVNVAGSAEDTSLDERCVDVVTAASALHWFDLRPPERSFTGFCVSHAGSWRCGTSARQGIRSSVPRSTRCGGRCSDHLPLLGVATSKRC